MSETRSGAATAPRSSTSGPTAGWAMDRRWWSERSTVERITTVVGVLLLVSGVFHALVLVKSGESWEGPLSYRKAASFGVSFGLTLLTVTWATSFIGMRDSLRNGLLGVFTVACAMETILVTLQVWRGVPSHYNLETSFDTAVAMSLAAGGGVIILCVLGFTAAALKATSSPSMRLGLRFGFVMLLLSMIVGALMIAKGVSLARDDHFAEAYATGGSLKPVHAVTLHAVLIVPGVAWLVGRTSWSEPARVRAVAGFAAVYAAVVAFIWIIAT